MVLARFEPVVTHFASGKSQSALKMGCFGTKNGSNMDQKRICAIVIRDHLRCSKVNRARFEPVVTPFGPWKIPKCLENEPNLNQQMGQEWVKKVFCQN